jgi:small neutral amino acid transporter SnatA (MarC family)
MMTAWLVWRFLKLVAVLLFGAGLVGAFLPASQVDRQRAVYWLATPGFVLTWLGGYAMTRSTGVSLSAGWVVGGMLLSLLAIHMAAWSVEREDRPRGVPAAVAMLALVLSLYLMIGKPGAETAVDATAAAAVGR